MKEEIIAISILILLGLTVFLAYLIPLSKSEKKEIKECRESFNKIKVNSSIPEIEDLKSLIENLDFLIKQKDEEIKKLLKEQETNK